MELLEIKLTDIVVGERQRKDFGDLEGLKFSIEQLGLLQPIVLEPRPDGRFSLIAGGRRLKACQEMGRESIPAVLRSELDELSRQELEYEENYNRKQLGWQEEVATVAKIHKLKKEKYSRALPGRFGRGGWSQRDTATELDVSEAKVSQDLLLSEALDTYPQLKIAKNRKDALHALRHIDVKPLEDETLQMKRIKDCFVNKTLEEGVADIDNGSVDLIIAELTHCPLDSTIAAIAPKLNITGNAFVFVPLEKFGELSQILTALKLPTKSKPFIWHVRGEDSYQTYVWFSRAMAAPPRYITEHTSQRRDASAFHTLAKPYSVYSFLVDNATLKGGFVFNPCSYDLALVKVCMDVGRSVRCVCHSKTVYEQCLINLEKKDES